jgi:hypothetical protein
LTAKPLQTKTTITSGIQIVIKFQLVLVQELERVRQLEESEYKKKTETRSDQLPQRIFC